MKRVILEEPRALQGIYDPGWEIIGLMLFSKENTYLILYQPFLFFEVDYFSNILCSEVQIKCHKDLLFFIFEVSYNSVPRNNVCCDHDYCIYS